jgi:hypothetical protein
MGVTIERDEKRVLFQGVVYENSVVEIRGFLGEIAPEKLICDLQECDDLHLAILQQILSYSSLYEVEYLYGSEKKVFQKMIEGFRGEDSCN